MIKAILLHVILTNVVAQIKLFFQKYFADRAFRIFDKVNQQIFAHCQCLKKIIQEISVKEKKFYYDGISQNIFGRYLHPHLRKSLGFQWSLRKF